VDQAIGDAIWATRPAGIYAGGTTSVTVVDDVGVEQARPLVMYRPVV
jgi:hypothetical protein